MYDDAPARAQMPLSPGEVEQIIASGGKLLKDSKKVVHFSQRVLATMARMKRTTEEMQRDVEAMRIRYEQDASPIARATKALRILSEEQRAAVLTHLENERIDALNAEIARMEQAQAGARSRANRVRFSLSKLLEEGLPAGAEARVQEILHALSMEAGPSAPRETGSGHGGGQGQGSAAGARQMTPGVPGSGLPRGGRPQERGEGGGQPASQPEQAPQPRPAEATIHEYGLDDLFS